MELCASTSDLRDEVLLELFATTLANLGLTYSNTLHGQVALVAHGGYGRRDVAPFSDVDLMILHARAASDRVAPLAKHLFRDVFDSGLVLGHSVRTPEEACRLAWRDPQICTSLIESRFLVGSASLFSRFVRRFRARVARGGRELMAAIERARFEERIKFGETVYLLEPNVKRSQGGLRDNQLLRWTGVVRSSATSILRWVSTRRSLPPATRSALRARRRRSPSRTSRRWLRSARPARTCWAR